MHKLFQARIIAVAAILITGFSAVSLATADTSSGWLDSPLNLQSDGTVLSPPSSQFGNIDCFTENSGECSMPTSYGAATSNSTVRMNNEGISITSKNSFVPVSTYIENRYKFFPVPNTNIAISYTGGPAYGLYLYFNRNFSSSISRLGGIGTTLPVEYHINRPPDGKLSDKNNRLLAADTSTINFSQNGEWMVVTDPNVATLRVNLRTFEVIPFASGFNYTIGLDPAVKTAISNDGRYAAVASKSFHTVRVYDLDTCEPTPNLIIGPTICQSRDIAEILKQNITDYDFSTNFKFLDDNILSLYATTKTAGISRTARYLISPLPIKNQLDYLALGDSYISGEGAYDYVGGTDMPTNKCHLSYLSYPFLIGKDINLNSYHSVACSGATTWDITSADILYKGQTDLKMITREQRDALHLTAQYLEAFSPGYINQLEFVTHHQPKAITVSIGGNDVNMIGSLKQCVKPDTCFSTYESRLQFVREINNHFKEIVNAYSIIKNGGPPGMKVYVIAYPQIAKPDGSCALNVHLNNDEVIFTTQAIHYLDMIIKLAAAKAGVYYVDTENAFDGHRLCEAGPGSVAMNGVTAGNDIPEKLSGPIGSESFHPNAFGHQLMEDKILEETHNLTAAMPIEDKTVTLPSEDNLDILNAPKSGVDINVTEYDSDISPDLAYQDTTFSVSINGTKHLLVPDSSYQAAVHSDPVTIGTYKTDVNGNLNTSITMPSSIPAGYHTLHFYGIDISGQKIDIYKDIYLAHTADDFDGNGIIDSEQACIGLESSGNDYDSDGIDDSCDGTIAPAIVLPPAADNAQEPVPVEPQSPVSSLNTSGNTQAAQSSSLRNAVIASKNEVHKASVLSASQTKPAISPDVTKYDDPKFPYTYSILGIGFISAAAISYRFRKNS